MPLKQSTFNFDLDTEQDITDPAPLLNDPGIIEKGPAVPPPVVIIKTNNLNTETVKKSPRGRMKLSSMNAFADQVEIPEDAVLFEKQYYSIGAVSEMFKVNQSLIRYWENEFDILKPKKNAKGDRFFRPGDIKNLQLIYQLLRERKYTIEGAKEFLKKNKKADEKFAITESLKRLRSFLVELKANL